MNYLEDANYREIMDGCHDRLTRLREKVEATISTVDGLLSGSLQYDPRSALIVAELTANLKDDLDLAINQIAVEMLHAEEDTYPRHPKNAIARTVRMSVTRLNAIDQTATPIEAEDDR